MSPSKILFMLSGSISAYKACTVISRLVQDGHQVQCVMSKNAGKFIGDSTLEGLTGRAVLSNTFQPGHQMDHIHLMNWCDLVIACPATANLINRFAAGNATDLLGNLFLAFDFQKPFLVFPAMNKKMWQHPITHGSVNRLREIGLSVYDPQPGALACGEVGPGRLWEPEDILREVQRVLTTQVARAKSTGDESSHKTITKKWRVLLTSGGTQEPIDRVRAITNLSTGETGAKIADALARVGHFVHWLHARGSVTQSDSKSIENTEKHSFTSAADLLNQMKDLLAENRYDLLIHAAAISDYTVESVSVDGKILVHPETHDGGAKLSSQHEHLDLRLKRAPKVISEIGPFLSPNTRVFAFKLTSGAGAEQARTAVDQLFQLPHVQWVVHNDEREFTSGEHRFSIYQRDQVEPISTVAGKPALAEWFQKFADDHGPTPQAHREQNREIQL